MLLSSITWNQGTHLSMQISPMSIFCTYCFKMTSDVNKWETLIAWQKIKCVVKKKHVLRDWISLAFGLNCKPTAPLILEIFFVYLLLLDLLRIPHNYCWPFFKTCYLFVLFLREAQHTFIPQPKEMFVCVLYSMCTCDLRVRAHVIVWSRDHVVHLIVALQIKFILLTKF